MKSRTRIMMERPGTAGGEHDTILADLLDELTERLRRGEHVDLDAYAARCPEHAETLRHLVPALRIFADAATPDADSPDDPSSDGGAASDMPAGRVLGDFRILQEIGRGGMGVVYEAEQLSLGRKVALKVLPFAAVLDPKHIQRFRNEAHAAAQLHHTNIVPVFSVGAERGVHYYAMQFIEGHSLADVIREVRQLEGLDKSGKNGAGGAPEALSAVARALASGALAPAESASAAGTTVPMPPRAVAAGTSAVTATPVPSATSLTGVTPGSSTRTRAWFRTVARLGVQAAAALEHAHEAGIVHRDVKPANLLVDFRGHLWVTDFGLAHCQTDASLTMSGDIVGTLRYMSPEQALAKRVHIDQRTDIYSLGVTLYELLTCEPAYDGRDRQELLRQIVFEEPRRPRRLNRALPADLETVVLKAMAKDPGERYGTAHELAADLERFIDDRPIEARRPTLLHRGLKWCRRRRWVVAAALVIAALAATSAALVWSDHHRRNVALFEDRVRRAVMDLQLGAIAVLETSGGRGGLVHDALVDGDLHALQGDAGARRVAAALDLLDEAACVFPRRPEVSYHRARALLQLGRPADEVDGELARALAHDPDFVPARILRAIVGTRREMAREIYPLWVEGSAWSESWLRAYRSASESRWDEASAAFEDLLRLYRENGEPYAGAELETRLGLALARLEEGQHNDSLEQLYAVKAIWPEFRSIDILLARTFLAKGEGDFAEDLFERMLRAAADPDVTALQVAAVFADLEDYAKALSWVERIAPGSIRERLRSLALGNLDRPREALEAARETVRLDGADARSLGRFGLLLWLDGQSPEALDALDRAVALDPDDASILTARGNALLGLNRSGEALEMYRRALSLTPQFPYPLTFLGAALDFLGRGDEAIACHERAVELADRFHSRSHLPRLCRVYLGWHLEGRGRLEEAETVFTEARRLPDYGGGTVACAEFFSRIGKHEEALGMLRSALAGGSQDRRLRNALAVTLLRMGDAQGALEHLVASIHKAPGYAAAYRTLEDLLRRSDAPPGLDAALVEALGELESLLAPGAEAPRLLHVLAVGCLELDALQDIEKARELAALAVQRSGGTALEFFPTLAEAQLASGRPAEAVRTLEEALALPGARRDLEVTLGPARRAALPDLPTYASIDAAIAEIDVEVLVGAGARWRFFRGRSEPDGSQGAELAWTAPDFDDGAWEEGPSGIGYGDGDDRTVLDDMRGDYTTVYCRHAFDVAEPERFGRLVLSLLVDDGCVVWLNGEEVGRVNAGAPGSRVPFDGVSSGPAGELRASELPIAKGILRAGRNCLAILVLNASLTSSDLSLIPELRGELLRDPVRGAALLESFRTVANGTDARARVAYLQGRLFACAGDHAAAVEELREAAALDDSHPAPCLRLAEALRAEGDALAALRELRRGIDEIEGDVTELWYRWFAIAAVDRGETPAQILSRLPEVAGTEGHPADLRRLLERLVSGDPVRINCGAAGAQSIGGAEWERDCFNDGGSTRYVPLEVNGTADDALYQRARGFRAFEVAPARYRIPLPPADYRVTLHFCENAYREQGRRVFSVRIEGGSALDAFDGAIAGRDQAQRSAAVVRVADGVVDLEFVHDFGDPMIAGIEIERVKRNASD